MANHTILGGKVHIYKRPNSRFWQCCTWLAGRNRRTTTKQESLQLAKEFAEDWYLSLRDKNRSGELVNEKTFREAAKQFEREYEIITEGQRSPRWVDGHKARLRLHLIPYFGSMGLSQITGGTVQEYRIHRMTPADAPNPRSKANRPHTGKPPSRSTLHDEIVTLRQVLKTAMRHGWLAALGSQTQSRSASTRPDRAGKTNITGYFDRPVKWELQDLATERSRALGRKVTAQELLGEALNDLFKKYGKAEIVPSHR